MNVVLLHRSFRRYIYAALVIAIVYIYTLAPVLFVYDAFFSELKGGVSCIFIIYRPVFYIHSIPFARMLLLPWTRLWGVSAFIDDIIYIDGVGFPQVL